MKKTFIITLFIFIANSSYSQQVLNKIFELRLGMTERELKEVVDTTLLEENRGLVLANGGKKLGGRIKPYTLERYDVTYKYSIEDIVFSFLDGKLYKVLIFVQNTRTEDLLTKKYGKPTISKNNIDGTIYKRWQTNDKNIDCWTMQGSDESKRRNYSLLLTDRRIVGVIREEQKKEDKKLLEDL